jgi:YHS domain-containing protein
VIRALLLFLLVLFLLRAVWRLLGGIVQGAISTGPAAPGHRPAPPPAVKMERDPICGTYVIPGKALELARGRERVYFCSDRCRDEWMNAH